MNFPTSPQSSLVPASPPRRALASPPKRAPASSGGAPAVPVSDCPPPPALPEAPPVPWENVLEEGREEQALATRARPNRRLNEWATKRMRPPSARGGPGGDTTFPSIF